MSVYKVHCRFASFHSQIHLNLLVRLFGNKFFPVSPSPSLPFLSLSHTFLSPTTIPLCLRYVVKRVFFSSPTWWEQILYMITTNKNTLLTIRIWKSVKMIGSHKHGNQQKKPKPKESFRQKFSFFLLFLFPICLALVLVEGDWTDCWFSGVFCEFDWARRVYSLTWI